MPEIKAISLFDLNHKIREVINEGFPITSWIIAEISEINENRSGHCYLELVDKNPTDESVRAISRATIWASRYRMIKPYFETTTGQAFTSGIKVMVSVKVDFHERYGFSLNIIDIEPSFTLGELARKRLEIIKNLEEDGVITMNQELEIPLVPQKIAIISSQTAAGYGDFIDQLLNNPSGYHYYTKLFPASMQGSDAGISIINALDKIAEYDSFFDVVVIIRGGGAKTDLSSFDDYDLAYYITQFPLPIIAGIGHERDESIVDLVANTSCKTPTAVAEYLLQQAEFFSSDLDELRQNIVDKSRVQLGNWKEQLSIVVKTLKMAGDNLIKTELMNLRETAIRGSSETERFIHQQQLILNTHKSRFRSSASQFLDFKKQGMLNNMTRCRHDMGILFKDENNRLGMLSQEADLQNPQRILKRGYSISLAGGKVLKNSSDVKSGDKITTRLHKGIIESEVSTDKSTQNTAQNNNDTKK